MLITFFFDIWGKHIQLSAILLQFVQEKVVMHSFNHNSNYNVLILRFQILPNNNLFF